MASPYGITEVDIPGIFAAAQRSRMGRIQQMLGERQLQAADRQADRENASNIALSRLWRPAGASGTTGGTGASQPVAPPYAGPPPGAAQPAVTPPGLPGANPTAPSFAAPSAPSTMRIDPAAAQALIQADPQHGPALLHSINQMNADQITAAQTRLQSLAPLYVQAARIPYGTDGAQRRAFIASVRPQLAQLGIDPAEAEGFDPTDANLNSHMSFGQTMDQALNSAKRHLREVNGQLVDEDALPAPTASNPVVYSDPILNTGAGPYRRADVMGGAQGPPQPGEVRQTSRGPMRFRGGDYRNPANYDPVQGGQTPPASGNFPRNNPGGLRVPGSDTQFQTFSTPAAGIAAQENLLRRNYLRGGSTVRRVVERYAPRRSRGGDNTDAQVDNYIAHVARRLGISPDDPIDGADTYRLGAAMREFETGRR